MTSIASVISFCTNDVRFLAKCLEGIRPFSKQILIPVCDHFYNGEPENRGLLNAVYSQYPDVNFIEFAYSTEELYGTPAKSEPNAPGWAQSWHNSARLVATYFLDEEIDQVLFLDVDEIFSASPSELRDYSAVRFGTYWYFGNCTNAATLYPNGPLLVKREELTTRRLLSPGERLGLYELIQGKKMQEYLPDGKPIVHHYSWVRPKEELQKKVKSWGHHWERDWESLLEKEGDVVRGYTYREVEPFWDPLQAELPKECKKSINVQRVTPQDIYRKELEELIRN